MSRSLSVFLGLCALAAVLLSLFASSDVAQNLSPQGCRMSYMSPSYIKQSDFNSTWTHIARRYSLYLYREVGWENELHGATPVLFIPGNAGSYGQVRSIASSATRQYFDRPYVVAHDFASRKVKPLDFFAIDFNEDLSAFHGPTIQTQVEYSARAISYILSLYPPNTSIIIMGHSMGGVVATSLLPSESIAAIITMSAPHTLPPARFDQRVDEVYSHNQHVLRHDPTPILSLCGGATDMMIPSESCILPSVEGPDTPFRRTVFSSALEGAWTGVGHREMVWCHQVRWRVARAALEISALTQFADRSAVLDKWLRDGHPLPPSGITEGFTLQENSFEVLPPDTRLVLKQPHGSRKYLLPVTSSRFVLFSQGSIPPVSPQKPNSLQLSVSLCSGPPGLSEFEPSNINCRNLKPRLHKLIPNPVPGSSFPMAHEGSDESDGIVLFEADLTPTTNPVWVVVSVDRAQDEGWVVGGFTPAETIKNDVSMMQMLFGGTSTQLSDPRALRTSVIFPKLVSNALVVYRITPRSHQPCRDALLPPLLMHTSHDSETHYFPLTLMPPHRILLHTHGAAPYIPSSSSALKEGVELVIYSSGPNACPTPLEGFTLSIDWLATLGRWPPRYFTTIACWAVGIVSLILFKALGEGEDAVVPCVPSVQQSLSKFCRGRLPQLLLGSFMVSLLPLHVDYFMGNGGALLFAPIAPLLVVISTGLVCVSWLLLVILMWPVGKIGKLFLRSRQREVTGARRGTLLSMCFIFLLIFFVIPWQVAYLCCWVIHLTTCATERHAIANNESERSSEPVAVPLLRRNDSERVEHDEEMTPPPSRRTASNMHVQRSSNLHQNAHLLLLMTWLLPLAAPVLVVWVRTLATAGLTTPFDGDHFFLNVAPFLVLVDFASWTSGPLLQKQSCENYVSARWGLLIVAGIAFVVGPRKTYHVFDTARIAIAILVIVRIGPRYWGSSSWGIYA